MSGFNLAAKPKEEQDKVALELVAREQPEHLKEFFWEQLPDKNAPDYCPARVADAHAKLHRQITDELPLFKRQKRALEAQGTPMQWAHSSVGVWFARL